MAQLPALSPSACLPQAGQNENKGAACGEIQISGLGKLLAHPFKSLKREETTLWLSAPTSSSSVSRKVRAAVVGCIPVHSRIPLVHLLVFPGLAKAPSVQTQGLMWALLLSQNLKYCGPERRILGARTCLPKILGEELVWLDPSPATDLSKLCIVLES